MFFVDSDAESNNDDIDMKAMGLDGAASDSDDHEMDGAKDEKIVRRDWGKKAEDFYESDLDFDGEGDDEGDRHSVSSDLAIQEEEALEYQTEQLKHLRTEDFDRDDLLLEVEDIDNELPTSLASTFEKVSQWLM